MGLFLLVLGYISLQDYDPRRQSRPGLMQRKGGTSDGAMSLTTTATPTTILLRRLLANSVQRQLRIRSGWSRNQQRCQVVLSRYPNGSPVCGGVCGPVARRCGIIYNNGQKHPSVLQWYPTVWVRCTAQWWGIPGQWAGPRNPCGPPPKKVRSVYLYLKKKKRGRLTTDSTNQRMIPPFFSLGLSWQLAGSIVVLQSSLV